MAIPVPGSILRAVGRSMASLVARTNDREETPDQAVSRELYDALCRTVAQRQQWPSDYSKTITDGRTRDGLDWALILKARKGGGLWLTLCVRRGQCPLFKSKPLKAALLVRQDDQSPAWTVCVDLGQFRIWRANVGRQMSVKLNERKI